MRLTFLALAAAALLAPVPTAADPHDHHKKVWEKRADCDKKLYEAKSRKDFFKAAEECNRELAKLDREQRREAAKSWREAEKKWREQNRYYGGGYYDWDDD